MDVFSIISFVALALGSLLSILSRIPSQTIKNQKILIETYEKRLKALEDARVEDHKQYIENIKSIAELQGQINVYKELPLRELADGIKLLSTGMDSLLKATQSNGVNANQNAKTAQADTDQVAKVLRNS